MVEDLSVVDSALTAPPCSDSVLNLLFGVGEVEGGSKVYQQKSKITI